MNTSKSMSPEQRTKLLTTLQTRFEANKNRHKNIKWADVETKLKKIQKNYGH